jgi:hypothetical protein
VDDNYVDITNNPRKDIEENGGGDSFDACLLNPVEWLDTDGCGTGNNSAVMIITIA